MAKRYNEKRRKAMEEAIERELDTGGDGIDIAGTMANDLKAAAMGGELYWRNFPKLGAYSKFSLIS